MKKSVIFLLAAVLLTLTATANQAPAPTYLSQTDASFLLQRTLGKWQLNKMTWNPEQNSISKYEGKVTITPSATDVSVREHTEIFTDGGAETEEGVLRYSNARHQFEFVKTDDSGKETVLFTGHWYPEYKTIMLTAVTPERHRKNKNFRPAQVRYVFLDNGTFSKMIYQANEKGKQQLMEQYHFTPAPSATAGL